MSDWYRMEKRDCSSKYKQRTDCHQMQRFARYAGIGTGFPVESLRDRLPSNAKVDNEISGQASPDTKHKLSPRKKECARGGITPGWTFINRERLMTKARNRKTKREKEEEE